MVYGYLRVSTEEQDNNKFKSDILNYANDKKLGSVIWIEEKISGVKDFKKRELGVLLNRVKKNDVIIVPELSRLARSIKQIYEIIELCREKGVNIHILKQGIVINGSGELNINTKIMLNTFSMIAELERDFISIRTKEALKERKKRGIMLGRKKGTGLKLQGQEDKIKEYLEKKIPVSTIAKLFNVSRLTVINYIKSQKIQDRINKEQDRINKEQDRINKEQDRINKEQDRENKEMDEAIKLFFKNKEMDEAIKLFFKNKEMEEAIKNKEIEEAIKYLR